MGGQTTLQIAISRKNEALKNLIFVAGWRAWAHTGVL
jgi:hypothetical protein